MCKSTSSIFRIQAAIEHLSPEDALCTTIQFSDCKCETMKNTTETYSQMTVAARIAGEDIKPGDFVTVLNELREWPSFMWSCSDISLPADEPVCIRFMPSDAGEPHQVIAVCLPFVYVKQTRGNVFPIDTRQQQLVRLDPANAKLVWKQMTKKSKKKKK